MQLPIPKLLIAAWAAVLVVPSLAIAESLSSWRDTGPKAAIVTFVEKVTSEGSPGFVPVRDRIAVFDDDGTLWVEYPFSAQLAFEFECAPNVLAAHPDASSKQPFKAALSRDAGTLAQLGQSGITELMAATHDGWSTSQYEMTLSSWAATTQHSRIKRPYTQLVYQPMAELVAYLRANGFEIYVVSTNSVEFVRPWAEAAYGVRPEQVIATSVKTKFSMADGEPLLTRVPELEVVADGKGKPSAIYQRIGRKPLAVFGNSDGDTEMLQWATMTEGPSLGVLLHHTDAGREFAYDRHTEFGRLDEALRSAPARDWVVIDMKNDWNKVFAFEAP